MSLLFRVLSAWHARGTQQKLALEGLRLIPGEHAPLWRQLVLAHADSYLAGVADPDRSFRDFQNHVLHVAHRGWGGAIPTAELWKQRAVEAFRQAEWERGVYAVGVLTHYLTDPLQPLHTAATPEADNIHRAVEHSIDRSYERFMALLQNRLGGFPEVEAPAGGDWVSELLTAGATVAHREFDRLVQEFDFATAAGSESGFSADLEERMALLLGRAARTVGIALARTAEDSAVVPPAVRLFGRGIKLLPGVPRKALSARWRGWSQQRLVGRSYREWKKTGRVERMLPDDARTVRDLLAQEASTPKVEKRAPASSARPTVAAVPTPAPVAAAPAKRKPAVAPQATIPAAAPPAWSLPKSGPRFHLDVDDPVADAPSISEKAARKLQQVGIACVSQFLEYTPDDIVSLTEAPFITVEDVRLWQIQARLMLEVPGLETADVQILTACGIEQPEQLAGERPERLLKAAAAWVESPAARKQMRNPQAPDKDAVRNWIAWAGQSRRLRAA